MDTLQAKPTKQIVSHLAEDLILLYAYRPKTFTGCKVCPLPDSTGKHWTGQGATGYYEDLSFNDKQAMAYVVTPTTYIKLGNGKTFNMASETDRINWTWIKRHPYVAESMEAGYSNRDAVLYVHNVVADAEARVTKTEMRDRIRFTLRFDTSQEALYEIASALNFPHVETASPTTVLDYLLSKAEENKETLDLLNDLLSNDEGTKLRRKGRALFHELLRYRVIDKYFGGVYRWSGEEGLVLGATEDKAVEFILDKKNVQTVEAMVGELALRRDS